MNTKMIKIQFLCFFWGILLLFIYSCQGSQENINDKLNREIEAEYQIILQEQEYLNKEHELMEVAFEKWKAEFNAIKNKLPKDPIYDEHQESFRRHNLLINENYDLINKHFLFLKEYLKIIDNHQKGKIEDSLFKIEHKKLLENHQLLLQQHQRMKDMQKTFEDTHQVVIKKANDEAKD